MKRNKLMAAAALLLALTMISTTTFSGVLAKYVISDYATDSARVAKFGVLVSATGALFGNTYGGAGSSGAGNVMQTWTDETQAYVSASASTAKVFAPGTKNEKGLTFTVKGTPEVSTKVTVDAPEVNGDPSDTDVTNTNVYLKSGNYSLMVPLTKTNTTVTGSNYTEFYKYTAGGAANKSGTFAVLESASDGGETIYRKVELTVTDGTVANKMSANYYPIKWKVNNGSVLTDVADVLSAVRSALGADATNPPAHNYNGSAQVTWAWDFGSAWSDGATDSVLDNLENTSLIDIEDTILGHMISLANGSTDFKIASGLNEVKYAEVAASDGSANTVQVAYVDASVGAPANATANTVIACLTATFGARVTVEQIDYAAPVSP